MDLRGNAPAVLLTLSIFCACAAVSGVLTAKAFYCRDPDTGKLYPVNSTWHSSSFCGKYTCKLRKKPQEQQATEQAQITIAPTKEVTKNCTEPIGIIIEDNAKADIQKLLHKGKENTYVNLDKFRKVDDGKDIELAATTPDGDRYLTEEEIKALSLLLQTMKKSDLEAILEVYNLAQDIYKELDKVADDKNIINDTQNEKFKDAKPISNVIPDEGKDGKKTVSYWYEPLSAANNKLKEAEVVETHQESLVNLPLAKPKATGLPKSFYEELNALADVKNKQKIIDVVSKTKIHDKPFFAGPLVASSDFRKLPYYHPLTSFQKQASYIRPTVTYNQPGAPQLYAQSAEYPPSEIYSQGLYNQAYFQLRQYPPLGVYAQQQKDMQAYAQQQAEEKPLLNYQQHQNSVLPDRRTNTKCGKPEQPFKLIPWNNAEKKQIDVKTERKLPFNSEKTYDPKNSIYSDPKLTAQNLQLPFSYLQNYNLSSINPYNGDNAWSLLSYTAKHKKHQPSYPGAYVAQLHEGIDSAGASAELKDEDLILNSKDSKEMPDWQTAPLSVNVLNEVKANIAKSKFLPYPFRKKVKLEKVGRLIRLDDGARIKRDATKNVSSKKQSEEYEVYIEKSTCETDTEPGFFRMGNTTEPFPACCPQRIS